VRHPVRHEIEGGETVSESVGPEHPGRYPDINAPQDLDDWNNYVANSLQRETASAERWRTGLAGFVTILTTALVITGPANVEGLAAEWKWLVVGLLGVGIITALRAAWVAQSAASPTSNGVEQLHELLEKWGSVRSYEVAVAASSASQLRIAKVYMAASIVALVLGVLAWWLVPTAEPPGTIVKIETKSQIFCGALQSIEDGTVVVSTAPGVQERVSILSVTKLAEVDSCTD